LRHGCARQATFTVAGALVVPQVFVAVATTA
jgi:hypothetical protein